MGSTICWAALAAGLLPGLEPRYVAPLLHGCWGAAGVAAAVAEAAALGAVLGLVSPRLWLLLRRAAELAPGAAGRLLGRVERGRERLRGAVGAAAAAALALFVAVPLPVTGVYTGALVAAAAGVPRRYAAVALAVGGAASALVTGAAAHVVGAALRVG